MANRANTHEIRIQKIIRLINQKAYLKEELTRIYRRTSSQITQKELKKRLTRKRAKHIHKLLDNQIRELTWEIENQKYLHELGFRSSCWICCKELKK